MLCFDVFTGINDKYDNRTRKLLKKAIVVVIYFSNAISVHISLHLL